MFKSVASMRTVLAGLVFGLAAGFGSFAFAGGDCYHCQVNCEFARQDCVANGGGAACFKAYRGCINDCNNLYPGCPIP